MFLKQNKWNPFLTQSVQTVSESSLSWKVIPGVPLEHLPLDRTLPSLLLSGDLGPASLHFYWERFEILTLG